MRDCTEMELLLSASLDGALSPDEAAILDAHLAGCPSCGELAGELAQISAAMQSLEEPAPDLLIPQVLRSITPPRRTLHWRRWGAMAAVFALIVAGGSGVYRWLDGNQLPPPRTPQAKVASGDQAALGGEYTGQGDTGEAAMPFAAAAPSAGENGQNESDEEASPSEPRVLVATTKIVPAPEPSGDAPSPEPSPAARQAGNDAPPPAEDPSVQDTDGTIPAAAFTAAPPEAEETDMPPGTVAKVTGGDSLEDAPPPQTVAAPVPARLTPAEAEAVLRRYLGDGGTELVFAGTLQDGGFYRFDRPDGGAYAISADGQQIVEQGAPEAAMIESWDTE